MSMFNTPGGNFGFQPANGTYICKFRGVELGEKMASTFKDEKTGLPRPDTQMVYWLVEVASQIDGTPIIDNRPGVEAKDRNVYRLRTSNSLNSGKNGTEAEGHKLAVILCQAAGTPLNEGGTDEDKEAQIVAATGVTVLGSFGPDKEGRPGRLNAVMLATGVAAASPVETAAVPA